MELIERINGLEGEVKLVKSEIKKVLVDLRETMNTAENPFAHLEFLYRKIGGGAIEKRLKTLEETMNQLTELGGGNGIDEEKLKNLEDSILKLKELGGGNGIEEERIKNLEEAMEQVKEMGNGIGEEKLKNLEDSILELKEMGSVEVERLENLEGAIEKLAEMETQLQPEKPLTHNPTTLESESELGGLGIGAGLGVESGMVDTVMLAQLMQWADSALNLIGMEKLNQIVELYGLTGHIPTELKDTILKIAELPDAVLNPEKEHVETKHCITALCELDRILTGEHQELFGLLKELCNEPRHFKNHAVKHAPIQTKSPSPNPGNEKGKGKKK